MTPLPYPRITRRQDHPVARMRDVAKGQAPDDAVLLDGMHLILDAFDAGVEVDYILATDDVLTDGSDDTRTLRATVAARTIALYRATAGVMDAASPSRTPSGVVAVARWPLSPLSDMWTPAPALALGLVDVQDPGNAGAVVRAADGLGGTGVIMAGATANPKTAKALRGAMGSTFRLPVARAPVAEMLGAAKAAGVQVAATLAPSANARDIRDADLTRPLLVLLGNEGGGLSDRILDAADLHLCIAMRPRVNSLNVAVSAALVLYEARRQRGAP